MWGLLFLYFYFGIVALGATVARAESAWIQAVGIDPDNPSSNYRSFYSDGSSFLSACKKSGLAVGSGCRLFMDTRPGHASEPTRSRIPSSSQTAGVPTAASVLRAFEEALDRAQPGDQVVFALSNHGSPGTLDPSCVHLGGGEKICSGDVAAVLERRKSGVKVFLAVQACFSGAFAGLQNNEVCTYTEADRWRTGTTPLGSRLWDRIDELKQPGRRLTLEQVRRGASWRTARVKGGGFGSQVIRDRVCRGRAADTSSTGQTWAGLREHFDDFRSRAVGGVLNLQTYFPACDRYYNATTGAFVGLKSLLDVLDRFPPEVLTLSDTQRAYCATRSEVNRRLCRALDDYLAQLPAIEATKARARAALSRYDARKRELVAADKRLAAASGSARAAIEAERGSLLESLTAATSEALAGIETLRRSPAMREVERVYDVISEEMCLDPVDFNRERLASERAWTENSLSALRSDGVPLTARAAREASECEQHFSLP